MKRSKKSTQQILNQKFALRRSTRLTDKFQKLPDELITKIFSNLRDNPKTLIRCSAVSKNWASFVSKTLNLSLRFTSMGGDYHSIPCSNPHNHIPPSAIPAVMNVFANLETLEVKLCCYPFPGSVPPFRQHIIKMKVDWEGNVDQAYTCMAFEVGLLSTIEGATPLRDFNIKQFVSIQSTLVSYFKRRILDNRPETLKSMVIMSSKMEESKSAGRVFVIYEQLLKLLDSISNSKVNESWLEDPQNVVYWHKNHTDKKHLLQEQLWLVYQTKNLVANRELGGEELTLKETDFKKLLDGLDDTDGDVEIRKHRSQDQPYYFY